MTTATWSGVDSARAYQAYLVPQYFAPFAARLVDRLGPRAGEQAVDLACGTGAVAREVAARGAETVGIDLNPSMLEVAGFLGPSVTWRDGDAMTPDLPDAAVDLITCQQGLQFLPDRAAALAAWTRALRPGGRLGVSVWRQVEHHPVFVELIAALDRCAGPEIGRIMRGPYSGPDGEELRDLLGAAGLKDVRVRIDLGVCRFPSSAEFLRRQVAGSPLAGPIAELPDQQVRALEDEVVAALQRFTDDDGLVFVMQTWVATAVR